MRLLKYLSDKAKRMVMSKISIEKLKFPVYQLNNIVNKPEGLWYGFGSSWVDWVKSEMPGWEGKFYYLLEVNESKILQLKNILQLEAFTEQYGVQDDLLKEFKFFIIDWKKVSKKYSGIEINPYIHEARFKLTWYYPWDVASGCIWKEDAIKSFEEINETS
jgi:hypothetical protein